MNGINYLLDTNIIIGFLSRNVVVLELFSSKKIKVQECGYSSITRMELLSFSGLSEIEKQAITSLLERMTYLAITPAIENKTIEFRHFHKTKLPDSIIAATAQYHQIELLTLDKKLATSLYQTEGLYPIVDQSQSYICGWTNDENALISENLPLVIFGDHTCILKMICQPFAQGADGIKIIKTNKQIEIGYLYQFLQFNPVVMEEYKRHFSILKKKIIFFPSQESGEQQKIADCLSSLDDLITAQTQKIEALKTHKKGLMQQLFPSSNEAS